MKTQTSKRALWLKTLLILPLLATLLLSFSTKEIIEKDLPFNEITPELIQEKATAKEIAEYNELAKKYNSQSEENRFIVKKDVERLKYLYNLMSPAQRKNAEPFPSFPPPPPAPNAIKVVKGVNDVGENIPPPPPPSSKAPKVMEVEISEIPAPPIPKPEKPIDYVVKMAKQGATFFYKGKQITSNQAIALLKKNDNLNISSKSCEGSPPVVKISKEPFEFE